MMEISILFTILLFSVFLVLGVVSFVKKTGGKWIYFTLSFLSLIGVIFMLFFLDWSLSDLGKKEQITTPGTEIPSGNGQQNETNPEKEPPPKAETPPVEEPSEEEPSEELPSVDVPTDTKPNVPEKIIVPDNATVDYKVVKNDTLWSIATRAEVTVEKVKQWNALPTNVIYVGQLLKLYGENAEPLPSKAPPKQDPPPTTASSVLISNGSIQKKEIALTFDAGSDIVGIGILDILKKHNVKATFFLTGKWAEKYPSYALRITIEGHELGNHTYSHPDAVKTTVSAFKQDIIKAEQAIINATGKSPQPYFRFPFGAYNNAALKTVGGVGYPSSIQWSLDTIDWQQPSVAVIISRIKTGASNGDIILMHIGGINTPEAVDKVIPWIKVQGYQLVTVGNLLN
nr:polysaccharide deacetylase family protein [Bacillus sp. (in: firmicutes)]